MPFLRHLPRLLLALNWSMLLAAFIWTSSTRGEVLWWLQLDWIGGLHSLAALSELAPPSIAGAWLLWLMPSVAWTLGVWLSRVPAATTPVSVAPPADSVHQQQAPRTELLQTQPELKEKIQRLHQSLERL